jgi:hypothetical protein
LEDWRRRLIDLSHRNRLIAFKPTKATTLRVIAPGVEELFADPERTGAWDFFLPPEPEEDGPDAEAASDTGLPQLVGIWRVDQRRDLAV